ncbi:MAG TPA: hypothetical protein VL967_14835 [Terracidiphilus sp.]|nr:hypothetical protein [Terracidiphilus sp.]
MIKRLPVLLALSALLPLAAQAIAQETDDSGAAPPKPTVTQTAPHRTATQGETATDAAVSPDQQSSPNQPQIIVNPPAAPQPEWAWHDRVAWGAGVVLAVLAYVGILLALRTLKNIDSHLVAVNSTSQAAMDSANAALALAQAIANSERPWIVVTVEPFLTMENSFKVMASNRGRSPARIISSLDQVKVASDETKLPKTPEFEAIAPGDEPEPIVLLPGEATGIWALNREDLPSICQTPEVLKEVERWQQTLFLYGRIQYLELASVSDSKMHETFWCCRYIHGEKNSALVMAGPPEYNKHS